MKNKFKKIMDIMRRDSEKGVRLFYRHYGKMIFAVAYSICKSDAIAKDILDRVLTKVWEKADEIAAMDIKNPGGWLYTVTLNDAKNVAKKERKYAPLNEAKLVDRDGMQSVTNMDTFFSMIAELSEFNQQVLIQKLILKNTFDEIAEDFGYSHFTISSAYYRALDKMKQNFENFEKF